jgi:hypothetical protein
MVAGVGDGLDRLGGTDRRPAEHLDLDPLIRVPDGKFHQKAIELCFGQPIGAVHLDRVLRCHHKERAAAPDAALRQR